MERYGNGMEWNRMINEKQAVTRNGTQDLSCYNHQVILICEIIKTKCGSPG